MPRRQREEDRDWRATLFVWRGVLDKNRAGSGIEWSGDWCPTDTDALPAEAVFDTSENHFDLKTREYTVKTDLEVLEVCSRFPVTPGTADELFWGLAHLGDMRLEGEYHLDQGDGEGHEIWSDDEHLVAVSIRGPYAVVAACGSTPFGRFVSLGYLDGEEMVLARRYVADDDVRAAWRTPADVFAGTDWGILEEDQESFDPEAAGTLASKLPWRVEPSKRGR